MAPLILYHFPRSTPSRVALLAIRNLDLEVEIREVNLLGKEQLKPDYLKINPQHCVPTIDDDGFILWESRAIAEYLAEKTPGTSLIPKDEKERALMHQRLYFDAGTLYPSIRAIAFPVFYKGETNISSEKRSKVFEAFDFMEEFLENRKWFCGEILTLADLSILASVSSIMHAGATLDKYPNLNRWYDQCKTSVKGFEENDDGARAYGEKLKSLLTEKF